MPRHIDFDSIENFRDFGDYGTACGRGVMAGRLYRSGNHSTATDADLARMRALGIATIVDLRHPNERRREPSRRWAEFDGDVIENDIVSDSVDWVEKLHGSALTPEWFYEDTLAHYRTNPFEARHVDLFRRFLHAVAAGEGAVVVHCAAGKDRTGLACAIFHRLAGVAHDDMVADFLLTNDESRIERKMAQAGGWLEGQLGRPVPMESVAVAVRVYPAYLDAALEAIDARCGSFDAYVEQVLGIEPAVQARIHEKVLGAG